jgi:Predicted signaling protein consisting of a modified GGDEF domain and a DHH domain
MEILFNKLTDLLSKYNKIIIMSHHDPDLDAIGSSMGLSVILNSMGKENYIFLTNEDKTAYNNSVNQALGRVDGINYIYPKTYKKVIDDNTVLVILDVHQKDRVEYSEILDKVSNVIVLDHHIKSNSYIKNTELFYIDSTMSSMVEFIAEYAKFYGVNLGILVSTVMMAGMEIDTNGFNLKTTEKTFEMAAYLTSMGADSVLKQELLKESKDNYLRRADFIKSSYIFNKNLAMCILTIPFSAKEELAEVAEELLKFEYVEASFVIGQLNENIVGVSARSIGNINVCNIMKQLGGGGHMTNAASQIPDKTVKEVEKMIRKVLGEFL